MSKRYLVPFAEAMRRKGARLVLAPDSLECGARGCVQASGTVAAVLPRTRYTPAEVQYEDVIRNEDRRQFISDDGIKCGETRDVQLHHQHMYAKGSQQTRENLVRFCRAYNLLMAERDFGRTYMQRFRN